MQEVSYQIYPLVGFHFVNKILLPVVIKHFYSCVCQRAEHSDAEWTFFGLLDAAALI